MRLVSKKRSGEGFVKKSLPSSISRQSFNYASTRWTTKMANSSSKVFSKKLATSSKTTTERGLHPNLNFLKRRHSFSRCIRWLLQLTSKKNCPPNSLFAKRSWARKVKPRRTVQQGRWANSIPFSLLIVLSLQKAYSTYRKMRATLWILTTWVHPRTRALMWIPWRARAKTRLRVPIRNKSCLKLTS